MKIEYINPKDLEDDVNATINFLTKVRKLNPHKCLSVLKILIDSFPKEYVYVENKVCNSQEQNPEKASLTNTRFSSVSCEHNTGEDKVLDVRHQISKSSPVQNSKKCTCKTPIYMYENNLKQDKIFCLNCKKEIGGRCGGEL